MGFLQGKLIHYVVYTGPWNKLLLGEVAFAGNLLLQNLGGADASDLPRERNETRTKKIPQFTGFLCVNCGAYLEVHPQWL